MTISTLLKLFPDLEMDFFGKKANDCINGGDNIDDRLKSCAKVMRSNQFSDAEKIKFFKLLKDKKISSQAEVLEIIIDAEDLEDTLKIKLYYFFLDMIIPE